MDVVKGRWGGGAKLMYHTMALDILILFIIYLFYFIFLIN